MTGNEIRQYPAIRSELVDRVLRTSGRVVNSTGLAFEMRFGVITGHRFNTSLKFRAILPKVMPQPRYLRPITAAKDTGIFFRALPYPAQVFIEVM